MRVDKRAVVRWAVAGFLLGAAVVAGGRDGDSIDVQLEDLMELAGRVRHLERARQVELPPVSKDGHEYELFHVADLTAGVPDWSMPDRHLGDDTEPVLTTGPAREAPQPYGMIEELMELLRNTVQPEAWEDRGVYIAALPAGILVRHAPWMIAKVRRMLDEPLRKLAHRSVALDVEILSAPAVSARAIAADPSRRPEDVERLFAGRVLALSRQWVVLWGGSQVATVMDADVEVAQEMKVADPVVGVEFTGGIVRARATVGAAGRPMRVELQVEYDELDHPVRKSRTREAGTLELAARTALRSEATLEDASGSWALAGEYQDDDERTLLLLVRPRLLERRGGAR